MDHVAEDLSHTKGWTVKRVDDVEIFTRPDGRQYARCQNDEPADVIVNFTSDLMRGIPPLRLVLAEHSYAVKGANTRRRRKERELKERGYDV